MKKVTWLRRLAEQGGKGVVNNIDARSLGRVADEIERLQTQLKRTEDALDKEFQNGIALQAENKRLRAEVKAEEDTVYSCMAKLKENGAEIERLRAALRMVIDNVETSSYESTGFWRTRHDRHR